MLLTSSIAITVFSIVYALLEDYRWMLALVIVHGVFWSGLLSASAVYMTNLLPERRRAEGIGTGLSTVAALAVAPTIGFASIAAAGCGSASCRRCAEPDDGGNRVVPEGASPWPPAHERTGRPARMARARIISVTLFLYSFGYGGITSFTALYAEANQITPKAIYLTTLAIVILLIRPMAGRLGDRWGYKRVFVPCLVLINRRPHVPGVQRLETRPLIVSAILFGIGFGTAYPVYVGNVMRDVSAARRAMPSARSSRLSIPASARARHSMGWLIQHHGFQAAFGVAAALSAVALPYFLTMDRMLKADATRS